MAVQVANLQRFDEDFGPGDDENAMAGLGCHMFGFS